MTQPTGRPVRVRTAATDKKKALEQYQDLRRSGKVARAVIITEDHDGSYTILGQMLKPHEIGALLLVGMQAVKHAMQQGTAIKPEAHIEPERRGERNVSKPRAKEITTGEDGVLVPPPGENFISCGECNHPHWFVLHHNDSDSQSRIACAHCGNEVKNIPIFHAEGHA